MRRLAAVLVLACALPAQAQAQQLTDLPNGTIATNGPVTGLARLGDTVYVRGDFKRIGTYAGSGVALDPATGARDPVYPALNGQVSDVLPDGEGGWYIGGDFRQAGQEKRRNLVHVTGDGMLDPAFQPRVDGFVDSMATDGTSLFIGGYFNKVGGKDRASVAAVNRTTGALVEGFDANIGADDDVTTELAYAAASGTHGARLFVGIGELRALDPATGAPATGFASDIDTDVRALTVVGERVYVGGNYLVALDVGTGVEDSGFSFSGVTFRKHEAFPGLVHVVLSDGDRLLVGGGFTALDGNASGLISLDPATGAIDPSFTPKISGDVFDLARFGDVLWAGGQFSSAEGEDATHLVAVDATTGARDQALAPRFDAPVYALATGDKLFAGGDFALVGFSKRKGYAALQASSGALDPTIGTAAHFGVSPYYDFFAGADRVFVGTERFKEQEGWFFPSRIRAYEARTGLPADSPKLPRMRGMTGFDVAGERIFIAQALSKKLFPHTRISVRNARSGKVLESFELPLRGYITSVEAQGSHLFIAGSFKRTRASGQRANIAVLRVNWRNGKIDDDFDPHVNGPVYDLTAYKKQLVLTGDFRKVGPENDEIRRPGFTAVDTRLGDAITSFDPAVYGGYYRSLNLLQDALFTNVYSVSSGSFLSGDSGDRFFPGAITRRTDLYAAERAGDQLFVAGNPVQPAEFSDHEDVHVILRVKASG